MHMRFTPLRRGVLIAACGALVLSTGERRPHAQAAADLVLINGSVLTVDGRDSVAQAAAITGGKITAVGTTDQIESSIGSATEVIDLRGRAVTPGLIDAHVHFTEADALFTVDLGDASIKTIAQARKRVAEYVGRLSSTPPARARPRPGCRSACSGCCAAMRDR